MFKDRLKELRLENGVTQKELGKIIGVGRTTISEYESGKILPKQEGLLKLADYFGVSVDYLTGQSSVKTILVEKSPATVIDLYEMSVRMLELLEKYYPTRYISINNRMVNSDDAKQLVELQIKHLQESLKFISTLL